MFIFRKNTRRSLTAIALIYATTPFGTVSAAVTPVADDVFAQVLPIASRNGNAVITAHFDTGQWLKQRQKPPITIKITADKQTIELRDDGTASDEKAFDGIYSGIAQFDFDALIQQYQRLDKFQTELGKSASPPVFVNRTLVGARKTISASNIVDLIKLGQRVSIIPIGISVAVDPERSLVIRDPSVVQDPNRTFDVCTGVGNPNGVWTFKHLMTEMANQSLTGKTPAEFTRMWLSSWETVQSINGWLVEERNATVHSLIIDPWEVASGGTGSPLNLDIAPFQLISIVNRVDLRENLTYGGGSAGEGRFVFQVMSPSCTPMQFTVIFEYGIEKNSCSAVKSWGQQWADLNSLTIGSVAYNTALENITQSFVSANAVPHKPNGSALNQLRTNEFALGQPLGLKWELREFVIADSGWNQHLLAQNTVNQTPDTSLDNSLNVRDFVNGPTTEVPLRFPTIADPFKGGSSITPFMDFWNHPGIAPRQKRHEFSLNTCNGCHAGETNTFFTHIKPGSIPVALSGFMTGINVTDPADGFPVRNFNEFARRASDLDALVNSSCFGQIAIPVLQAVH